MHSSVTETKPATPTIDKVVDDILQVIEREREREIISRRFGLYDRKETLEQIGELLGITRERVRQLEKAVLAKLKTAAEKDLPHIDHIDVLLHEHISQKGHVARITDISIDLNSEQTKLHQSRIAFLAELSPNIVVIDDNDFFHHSAAVKSKHDDQQVKEHVKSIIEAIKKKGEPVTADELAELVGLAEPSHAVAIASISKQLATLNGLWGLAKWPLVNPKNIRDKIYVILKEQGKHMHFNDIASAIKDSSFRRKDVTTQAIHNELIKDKRFVLVGRGMYALKEWGYKKGTVADMITDVLKKEGKPLHRDEIVKRVLKHRFVKETTILLNLQGKPQFKRVAKATYTLADPQ